MTNAAWTDANQDWMTVQASQAAAVEPWADQPTRITAESCDSVGLDAQALFGDLPFMQPPAATPAPDHGGIFANGAGLRLPSPSHVVIYAAPVRRGSANAQLVAVALCGVLALAAAFAASVFFNRAPSRGPATAAMVAAG